MAFASMLPQRLPSRPQGAGSGLVRTLGDKLQGVMGTRPSLQLGSMLRGVTPRRPTVHRMPGMRAAQPQLMPRRPGEMGIPAPSGPDGAGHAMTLRDRLLGMA